MFIPPIQLRHYEVTKVFDRSARANQSFLPPCLILGARATFLNLKTRLSDFFLSNYNCGIFSLAHVVGC